MTSGEHAAHRQTPGPRRSEPLQDEVYRQMFRLESGRPGAALELAVALLRAWMASGALPRGGEQALWLHKISPICLEMIEATLGGTSSPQTSSR
jgi:hypothetical protein